MIARVLRAVWPVVGAIAAFFAALVANESHHPVLAFVFFGCLFFCGVVMSRRGEAREDRRWEEVARKFGATYRGQPGRDFLGRFDPAPWQSWRDASSLYCRRLIEGPGFWLFNITESLGDATPREVTMAVVARGPEPGAGLEELPWDRRHWGRCNARYLFLWMPPAFGGPGRRLRPSKMPELLIAARSLARDLDRARNVQPAGLQSPP